MYWKEMLFYLHGMIMFLYQSFIFLWQTYFISFLDEFYFYNLSHKMDWIMLHILHFLCFYSSTLHQRFKELLMVFLYLLSAS